MLKLINLYTIDKILNEVAEIKLSTTAKFLYINCLTHHFRDKPATTSNSIAFDIFISDIPDFKKLENHFEQLDKAGLIEIQDRRIKFLNHWGQSIDRTLLDKLTEVSMGTVSKLASEYKEELLNRQSLYELIGMQHKLSIKQIDVLIETFVKEQDTFEKKYSSFSDCLKHFSNWVRKTPSKPVSQTIVSNRKVIGKDK